MEHQSKNIIQKNITKFTKASSGVIEVIQSNSSTIDRNTSGEIRIVQTNTSTIQNPIQQKTQVRRESRKDSKLPEIAKQNTGIEAEPPKEVIEEPVLEPVAAVSTVVIPDEVITGLNTAAGKIKAQIANQFFKTRLLQLISKAKDFLKSGKVPEAMAVLTVITDELEYIFDCSSTPGKQSVNLVRKSLIEAERELAGIM